MKKNFRFLSTVLLLISVFIMSSCSTSADEDLEILKERELQKEQADPIVANFKTKVKTVIRQNETRGIDMTESQVKELRTASLDFFKAKNIEEKDYQDFMSDNDPRLVLLPTFYAGLMDSNPDELYSVQSRSADDDDFISTKICYNATKAVKCAVEALEFAIGINELKNAFGSGCITVGAARSVFKAILKKFPYIAAGAALVKFTACMM